MRRGPKLGPISLTAEANDRLTEWTRRHTTSQALALRARIVLASQQDRSNREIARQVRATPQTVGKWRTRFIDNGIELLAENVDFLAGGTLRGRLLLACSHGAFLDVVDGGDMIRPLPRTDN